MRAMNRFGLACALLVLGCGETQQRAQPCVEIQRLAVDGGMLVATFDAAPPADGGADMAGADMSGRPAIVSSVCVPSPTQTAARTACGTIASYCDPSATPTPALDCVAHPVAATVPATRTTVTVTGFVRALESGPDTAGLTVQLVDASLLQNGADPTFVQSLGTQVTALDGANACSASGTCANGFSCLNGRCWSNTPRQLACDTDLALGCVFPLANGCNNSCNDGLAGRRDDRKYCRDDLNGGTCRDRLRWEPRYTIVNVTANHAIVARVTGAGNAPNSTWATTVQWNLFPSTTSARACSSVVDSNCLDASATPPIYRLDVTALAQSDWRRLAQQAGLPGGSGNGRGAVVGEVHDCADVRVANATVAVTPGPDRMTYYIDDPLVLRADVARATVGTDSLGRFAAFGVHPGRVSVTAVGIPSPGAAPVPFGVSDLFVYDAAMSLVTVNGGRGLRPGP
jgi:hypothetical protein